jgi:hypothetical protein
MEVLLPQIMDGVLSFLQDPVSTFIAHKTKWVIVKRLITDV